MAMTGLIDSHAHVYYSEYGEDAAEVVGRAAGAGVRAIVCPGTNLTTTREALAMASDHDMVYAAVGVHPHEASSADDTVLGEIGRLRDQPKVVAIGEIGLDYHYNFSPPDVQRRVFEAQIRLARTCRLPVIIHSREAEEDTLRLVEEAVNAHPDWRGRPGVNEPARGVFHCFPGDLEMARRVLDLGFYVSFPGPVTFPVKPSRPNVMAEVAASVPLDRVLIETDSPYLTPHPHRGKKNEPSYLPLVAGKLAELRGIGVEDVCSITAGNAERLFGIPPAAGEA